MISRFIPGRKAIITTSGAVIGFMITGDYLGCVAGLVLFAFFVLIYEEIFIYGKQNEVSTTENAEDFMLILLTFSASVIRADGNVKNIELNYVSDFFKKQFGESKMNEYIIILKNLMSETFDIQEVSQRANLHMSMAYKLQLIHYLFGVAFVDGNLKDSEIYKIYVISHYLKIDEADFNSIKAMYQRTDDAAYIILETTREASNAEIKKSYRQMTLKYHPDKVNYLGADVQKAANEKFRSIVEAYELIKKERNFN